MKKSLMVAILLMVFAFAGCGNQEVEEQVETPVVEEVVEQAQYYEIHIEGYLNGAQLYSEVYGDDIYTASEGAKQVSWLNRVVDEPGVAYVLYPADRTPEDVVEVVEEVTDVVNDEVETVSLSLEDWSTLMENYSNCDCTTVDDQFGDTISWTYTTHSGDMITFFRPNCTVSGPAYLLQ